MVFNSQKRSLEMGVFGAFLRAAVIFFNNLFFKTMPRFRILQPKIGQGTEQRKKNVVTTVTLFENCSVSNFFAVCQFIQAREDTIYNETTAGKKDTLLLSFMGQ